MPENMECFVFRGERKYLHSTSLFDFILSEYAARTGTPRNIDFTFLRQTQCFCRVAETKQGGTGLVATYTDDDDSFFLYETDRPIEKAVPYDEPAAGKAYTISGNCAAVQDRQGYSFMELAVAAYKEVLTVVFPEFKGRYLFARIVLERIPDAAFEICYRRKVARHFFEGEIREGEAPVGLIYYGI